MIITPNAPRARLFTVFGTVLYVDVASGHLRHGPVESSPVNALFVAEPGWGQPHRMGCLMQDKGDSLESIVCLPDHCQTVSSMESGRDLAVGTPLELVPLERRLIALTAKELFLTADPNGAVSFANSVCSTWECFLASEDWCTDGAGDEQLPAIASPKFDTRRIKTYLVHPMIRKRANANSTATKVLIYGYPQWSHGRVYYDLSKQLHRRGYIVDIINWQENHHAYIADLIQFYDLFMTALDGVRILADGYGVPYDRIIALSHSELDIKMLIEQKDVEVFDRFASYGVISEFVYCASLIKGVQRVPQVVSPGINFTEFYSKISECLSTVGYASSMSLKIYDIECKRGDLAEAAASEAGLEFRVAGSAGNQTSFHDMPEFYRSVDAVLTSSISEAGQLPVMEAAAAGRLVIGTPVGHFPRKAYEGGGILAPIEAGKFKAFTVETLRYYRDNPAAYQDKCHAIQEAARKFDWKYTIDDWVELIETAMAGGRRIDPAIAPATADTGTGEYEFAVDWFSDRIPTWEPLLAGLKPARILEIGSFEGRSACYLIEACSRTNHVEIYCVDTWEGGIEHDKKAMAEVERRFDHNVAIAMKRASHGAAVVKKLKKKSVTALAEILSSNEPPFDLIYVDGSHQASDVLTDSIIAFQLLRVGGVMIFDDYLWSWEPAGKQDTLNMPKAAIDSFINLFQRKLRVISGLPIYQLYIEKLFS
jgi:glycosyltransferase involved in cell wall biosynthesis/predicted O-methyltransferase YrrM